MRHIHRSKKEGFTLIETMLSAIVLGIALIAFGVAFYGGFIFIDEARQISLAALEAQEEMESIRTMTFTNILNLRSPYTFTVTGLASSTGTVTLDNIYGNDNIRRVSVKVSWTTRYGKQMTKSLVTLITNRGASGLMVTPNFSKGELVIRTPLYSLSISI